MPEEERPWFSVSIARKVQPARFETADLHLSISHVPLDASPEEVDALVEEALNGPVKIVYQKLTEQMAARISEMREEGYQAAMGPPDG